MTNLIKTTITIPEDILQKAKLLAVYQKSNVSQIMREALEEKIYKRKKRGRKDPLEIAGKFHLEATNIYKKRSDLYENHTKRKMGL